MTKDIQNLLVQVVKPLATAREKIMSPLFIEKGILGGEEFYVRVQAEDCIYSHECAIIFSFCLANQLRYFIGWTCKGCYIEIM